MVWLAWFFAALFLASYGGALHPAFDALTVVRVPLAACLLLLVLHPRVRRWSMAGPIILSGIFLGQHALAPLLRWAPSGSQLTIYQNNLWYGNRAHLTHAETIRDKAPDLVTFQEVSTRNSALLDLLRDDYPYQHLCRFSGWSGIAILSSLPVTDAAPVCSTSRGFAALEVQTEVGPRWVVSTHLPWPWPYAQEARSDMMRRELSGIGDILAISGDFNAMPWSRPVSVSKRDHGLRYIGPGRATYWLRGLPLPLDHVLAKGGRVERLDPIGSDHTALLAHIVLQ